MPKQIRMQIVEEATPIISHQNARQMLVGPGHNEPEPFPGWGGFVGWTSPLRLRSGVLIVGFSAGYWHGSPPTPWRVPPETLKQWIEMGMPADVDAPRGGRAMLIRSTDDGRTWSAPTTIIDTPDDDRHPNFIELADGTILCSFFRYSGVRDGTRANILRSTDGGLTWSEPSELPSPLEWDATDGPFVQLRDGGVLIALYGDILGRSDRAERIAVFRTDDSGVTWRCTGVIEAEHELSEPGIVELPDGRLIVIARPEGAISWSDDGGETWTEPASFGMRMYEPGLLVLADGTLVCLYGSYNDGQRGGLHAMFSRDGGETWIAPAPDYGFSVDPSVYGYCRGILLPDGDILMSYLDSGGHHSGDARTEKIWSMRFRVRDDLRGIERRDEIWSAG